MHIRCRKTATFNLIGRKGLSKKSFLAFSLVDKSALIINFEGREAKGCRMVDKTKPSLVKMNSNRRVQYLFICNFMTMVSCLWTAFHSEVSPLNILLTIKTIAT